MARRSSNNPVRKLDPNFFIPDGMVDWAYDEDAEIINEEVLEDSLGSDFGIVDEGDSSVDDAPMVIDTLTIVSQTIRRLADGSQVVDLIVEVDNVPGAVKYDLRVTKV